MQSFSGRNLNGVFEIVPFLLDGDDEVGDVQRDKMKNQRRRVEDGGDPLRLELFPHNVNEISESQR